MIARFNGVFTTETKFSDFISNPGGSTQGGETDTFYSDAYVT